ncbi:MAG: hypothetical protein AAF614_16695 [Chloroflexota bacterium]
MKLGDIAQVTIGVGDIAASHDFFQRLGFQTLGESQEPWPWVQLTDGQNLWLLSQDGYDYFGLSYFSTTAAEKVAQLEEMGITFGMKQEQNGRLSQAVFDAGHGLMVALIDQDPSQMPKPAGQPLSHCGPFGELAVPVPDYAAAASYWEQFDFTNSYSSLMPYRWGIFSDKKIVLGIHQTDDFKQPTMTYFANNVAERIKTIQANGISLAKEMKNEDGKVTGCELHTHSGQVIFVFSGEM